MKQWKAFFVRAPKKQNKGTSNPENIQTDLFVFAIAKRMGMSFSELNELSLQEILDLNSIYHGKSEKTSKMATQQNIDNFF